MTQRTDASERSDLTEFRKLAEAHLSAANNTIRALRDDNKALREALAETADALEAAVNYIEEGILPADWDHLINMPQKARAALASALPDPKENKT